MHLRVVVLGFELADDTQVGLVRPGIGLAAGWPVRVSELECPEDGSD